MQEPLKEKQNIFDEYCKEYQKLLDPSKLGGDWRPVNNGRNCMASKMLFGEKN